MRPSATNGRLHLCKNSITDIILLNKLVIILSPLLIYSIRTIAYMENVTTRMLGKTDCYAVPTLSQLIKVSSDRSEILF